MTLLSIASHISQAAVPLPIYFFALGPGSSAHAELWDSQFKSWVQHHGLHSHMASGAEPGILDPVSQIQESRRVEDSEIFGSRMAVLTFTSFLNRSWNVFNVCSSALSWTIAAQAPLYTLE